MLVSVCTKTDGLTSRMVKNRHHYMPLDLSSVNTEILQFEWFISGRTFPVFSRSVGEKFRLPDYFWNKVKFSLSMPD